MAFLPLLALGVASIGSILGASVGAEATLRERVERALADLGSESFDWLESNRGRLEWDESSRMLVAR